MAKNYYVKVPLNGYAEGWITADSEDEAIEQFAEQCTIDDVNWGVDASRGEIEQEEDIEEEDIDDENIDEPKTNQ